MATVPVANGFTQDVITLVSIAEEAGDGRMRDMVMEIQDPEDRVKFLREGLIDVMRPFMHLCPPFVQSIVARALMDHVDWEAVVERVLVIPENN